MSSAQARGLPTDPNDAILALLHDELIDAYARNLPDLLDALAQIMVESSGCAGGLLLAIDEDGQLLAVGADIELEIDPAKLFDAARRLLKNRKPGRLTSFAGADGGDAVPSPRAFAATTLEHRGVPVALAVLELSPADEIGAAEGRLSGLQPLLPVAILAARRSEAWRRLESLQTVLRELFARMRPEEAAWPLETFVEQLRALFRADVATLLLAEDDELRLAATTDCRLVRVATVAYRAGEGVTGWVFANGRALRLVNARDGDEVRRLTGLERTEPKHAEHDPGGEPTEIYLGVPMRFAGRVVGVVRLSRRLGAGRFSREDERSLQVGADLLGAGLARSRDMLLFRAVLDSTSEAIAVSSRQVSANERVEARVVLANRGMAQLLGRSPAELHGLAERGLSAREFYAPEDYEALRTELLDLVHANALPERHWEIGPLMRRLRAADGSLVAVNISYRVVVNPLVRPATFYTIGIARRAGENDEMAARHQRMVHLLDAMGIAYFRADAKGYTQESTSMDEQLTGYTRQELAKMPRSQLYSDPAKRDQLVTEATRDGGLRSGLNVQFRRKNGETFWAGGDIRVLFGPDQEMVGIEGLYRDVTPRVRLQQFLNADVNELLTEAEIARRVREEAVQLDYVANIGHQIQVPLSSLVGTLDNYFTLQLYSSDELAEKMPWVIGQVRVAARLVRNHSFMDKILRGEELTTQPVSLSKLAIETKLDFLHLLHDRKLEIDDQSLDRLQTVDAHPDLMRQVVVNLVDNAIKYSAPGSLITVRGHQWPAGRVFEVGSRGLPISDEDRRHIFERGYRSPRAQALIPHGSGIGLWLVKRIVELHKARIQCNVIGEEGRERVLFQIIFPHQSSPTATRGSHDSRQQAANRSHHRRRPQ